MRSRKSGQIWVARGGRGQAATLLQMQPEELRALLAAGYSTDPPADYRQLTPEQWAAADLNWVAKGAKKLALALNPKPEEVVAHETAGPRVVETDAPQE